MKARDVLIKPILTEKSTHLKDSGNKFSFFIHKDANKIEVKKAIKELYGVEPVMVNIINRKGKRKRVRYRYGYKASTKRAVVTLKKGDSIGIFEGA